MVLAPLVDVLRKVLIMISKLLTSKDAEALRYIAAAQNRGTPKPPLPDPITGRGPRNLKEELAIEQAQSSAKNGLQIGKPMGDPRFPASAGWVKMSQNINGVEVHYIYNVNTGKSLDFKIN